MDNLTWTPYEQGFIYSIYVWERFVDTPDPPRNNQIAARVPYLLLRSSSPCLSLSLLPPSWLYWKEHPCILAEI
jgi:hypothetical protein